ncbi:MAG: hypothetical protein CVV21_11505 [Candidatus Goldiibacteriota bacterium HGW-Goldbacteria-1]|nr:MAG: hypothetical protein CVV21_11505 [Candidatus Goldiibacteriota bacterium HGW-Goldbacteria-1]
MAKKRDIDNRLVCEYLEFISIEIFNKYRDIIKNYIQDKPGIYSLYKDNKLVYVGLASNMINRLKTHRKDKHAEKWDRFSIYLTATNEHLKELESLLLRVAEPKRNSQSGKLSKALDLERKLRKDMSDYQRKEREYIFKGIHADSEEIADEVVGKSRTPSMLKYLHKGQKGFKIRLVYKGKTHYARVDKKGNIKLNGKVYTSPSFAGNSIRHNATNGWDCWEYEKRPGKWVKIDELRK